MKRLLITFSIVAALVLSGCSAADARHAVLSKYPGCSIGNVPGSDSYFIIRKPDGSVWYAYANGNSRNTLSVTNDVEIIPAFSSPALTPQPTLTNP